MIHANSYESWCELVESGTLTIRQECVLRIIAAPARRNLTRAVAMTDSGASLFGGVS